MHHEPLQDKFSKFLLCSHSPLHSLKTIPSLLLLFKALFILTHYSKSKIESKKAKKDPLNMGNLFMVITEHEESGLRQLS